VGIECAIPDQHLVYYRWCVRYAPPKPTLMSTKVIGSTLQVSRVHSISCYESLNLMSDDNKDDSVINALDLDPRMGDHVDLMLTPHGGPEMTRVRVLLCEKGKYEKSFKMYCRSVLAPGKERVLADESLSDLDPRHINLWFSPPRDPDMDSKYQARLQYLVAALMGLSSL